jgi:hypothetical protein
MKLIRCRLEKVRREGDTKRPTFVREWIPEAQATLGNVIVRAADQVSSWKIVSIDRGTFMERVV